MIRINCNGCKKDCCGKIKNLRPILLPFEEKKFKKYSDTVKTPYKKVFILKQKKDGRCIFFDDKKKKCKVYDKRPVECKLYPFLLDFKKNSAGIILDKRFCKNLKSLKYDEKKIMAFIHELNFPKDWIKADESIEFMTSAKK
jgi:Fe-S-cluster containining protein